MVSNHVEGRAPIEPEASRTAAKRAPLPGVTRMCGHKCRVDGPRKAQRLPRGSGFSRYVMSLELAPRNVYYTRDVTDANVVTSRARAAMTARQRRHCRE